MVQTFYMKFAKDLYKWDMAQYFTPTTVTGFLVDIVNPQFGEHIAEIILQRLIQGYEKLKGTPLPGMFAFAG